MIDAERLDRAFIEHGGDHAPFHRLMSLRLELAVRAVAAPDVIRAAAGVAKESGEAVSALIDAATGNCPNKRRVALKEGEEAMASLTDALAALRAVEA